MTNTQLSVADRFPDGFGQFQEAQGVGHDSPGFADPFGDVFLGELELGGQMGISDGFLDRIEVFPLEILDQGEFHYLAVGGFPDHDRGLGESGLLGGAPTAFPGNQFKSLGAGSDDQRLDDALFPNGVRQFLQGLGQEVFTRLKRAGMDAAQREVSNRSLSCRRGRRAGRRRRGRGGSGRSGASRTARQQCAQASSQSRFRHGGESRNRRTALAKGILPIRGGGAGKGGSGKR